MNAALSGSSPASQLLQKSSSALALALALASVSDLVFAVAFDLAFTTQVGFQAAVLLILILLLI
jgi:hypothetical protein